MQPQFDIFKISKNEFLRWVEAAETVDAAKIRVHQLLKSDAAGDYLVFNQQTQEKISVKSNTPVEFKAKSPA
jgi:hypothetical protein